MFIIREMVPGDVFRGFTKCLESLSPVNLTEQKTLELFYQRQVNNHTFVAVDCNTNEILGTATLHLDQKYIHSGGLVGQLEDVAVLKECQGQGIGSLLIDKIISKAKQLDCYKLILNCKTELLTYYSQFGFKQKNYLGGEVHQMRLDLNGIS